MFPIRDTQPSYSRPIVNSHHHSVNVAVFLHEITLDEYLAQSLDRSITDWCRGISTFTPS